MTMILPLRKFGALAVLSAAAALLTGMYRASKSSQSRALAPDFAGQCFKGSAHVDFSAPCAPCVHFVTIVVQGRKWANRKFLSHSLRTLASTLRTSQGCFTLHAYTNAPADGEFWNALVAAGGTDTRILPYPTDLPRNWYSGIDYWLELSRRKLDLVERDASQFGKRAIWTDLDTVVVVDLRCVYARAPNFFVTITDYPKTLRGPADVPVVMNPMRTTFGDLWMPDARFGRRLRSLERSGMPRSTRDIQDMSSLLMHRCDGSEVDLRSLVRAGGFATGGPMAFGWDCNGKTLPGNERPTVKKIINGTLHCRMRYGGFMANYPVATLSFNSKNFEKLLKDPRTYFNTPELWGWARKRGIAPMDASGAPYSMP